MNNQHPNQRSEKMSRRYIDLLIVDTDEPAEFSAVIAITRAGAIALGEPRGMGLQGVSSIRTAPSRVVDYVRQLGVSWRDDRKHGAR